MPDGRADDRRCGHFVRRLKAALRRLAKAALPLRAPEFRKLYVGQSVSALGDGIVPVALAFAVLRLGGSPRDLGLVLAAAWLPTVTLLLLGGVLADRFARQRVMIASDLVRLAAQGTTAALLISGHAHIWTIAVLQVMWGTASAFFRPASSALIPQTVGASDLQSANALSNISVSFASLVGPAVSGTLVATVGPGWAFALDAATFGVSVVSLALLRIERVAGRDTSEPPSLFAQFRAGWLEFRQRTWLWTTVLHATLFHLFVLAPILVLGPVVAARSLGGAGAWAAVTSSYGGGAIVGGIVAMHVPPRRPLIVGIALMLLFVGPLTLLGIAAPVFATAPAAAAAGIAFGVYVAIYTTAIQQNVPADMLARVSAYEWFGSLASLPVGLVAVGSLGNAIGSATTLKAAAASWAVVTLSVLMVPSIRRIETGGPSPGDGDPDSEVEDLAGDGAVLHA
jgi:MFS family permease